MADFAAARSLVAREALRAWAGSSVTIGLPAEKRSAMLLAPPLSSVLPEGGFPLGSVVEVASVPGASSLSKPPHRFESMDAWSKVTRRLSLAVEKTPTTVFLLTRSEAMRSSALPAAMRVELESGGPDSLFVRVAKD